MSDARRESWERRHRETRAGAPEPSVAEMIAMSPRGRTLDLAAGTGRNALALARAGRAVVAADYSGAALAEIARAAAAEALRIEPVMADLTAGLPFREARFDAALNVNFLERALIPEIIRVLRPGGALLFDTFLIDEAGAGHPRDPRFTLGHYELRGLLGAMELMRYREGLVEYASGRRVWRATALARRREPG